MNPIVTEKFTLFTELALSTPTLNSLKIDKKIQQFFKGTIPDLSNEELDRIASFFPKKNREDYYTLAAEARKEIELNLITLSGYPLEEYLGYLVRKLSISLSRLNNNALNRNIKLINGDFGNNLKAPPKTSLEWDRFALLSDLIMDSQIHYNHITQVTRFIISRQQYYGFKNLYDSFNEDTPKSKLSTKQNEVRLTHREHILIHIYKEKAGYPCSPLNRTTLANEFGSKRVDAFYSLTSPKSKVYKPPKEKELVRIKNHLSKFPNAQKALINDLDNLDKLK
ncbi:hypothetical protein [Pedobacter sp.]|jgi:hypothetical protein|uniref:hypothetical protein n=1 Tax=Pedobacter sp. TaxID=1411316 RepID=UPI002BB3E2FB|nr:hypothetical protein [Pedobacter sp.]HWW39359.1 hypothetical protein [Pedobacter sp.]